jgi:hypothetical protein
MTVSELIEELKKFKDEDKLVIIDDDGNTFACPKPRIWNFEDEAGSPVAFFV